MQPHRRLLAVQNSVGYPPKLAEAAAAAADGETLVWDDAADGVEFCPAPGHKRPVRAATTGALPAHTDVGNDRTANANGALPAQDGVTLTASDRLLDKNNGTTPRRGIWDVTDIGSATTPWKMRRSADADALGRMPGGTCVVVSEGTTQGNSEWQLTTDDPITPGVTAQTWMRKSPIKGAVGGPAFSIDNQIVRWDGSDANQIQGSGGMITDDGGLSFSGRMMLARKAITAADSPYAWAAADYTIEANAAAGAIVINLNTVAQNSGLRCIVKKIDASANTVTIDPAGAETIDGAATYVLTAQWQAVCFWNSGAMWLIEAAYP